MTAPPSPTGPQPPPFVATPNAERYLLEADNLRRRQLRSALLHGSSRTWRDRRRIWPAVIVGIILAAIIAAAIAITGTFQQQQRLREEERRERQEQQQQFEQQRQEQQRRLEDQQQG